MTVRELASALGKCVPHRRPGRRAALVVVLLLIVGVGAVQGYAWYHLEAARSALESYQNDAARRHLTSCLWVWPRSPQAHLLAARAQRRAGNLNEAARHLDICQEIAGTADEDIAFEWALYRAAAGDLPSVEESLQARVLSRPAEAPLIWEALAAGYRRTCRMPDALSCLNAWLRFEPDNAYAYFLRGELHRVLGAVSRARDEYQRVVDLQPDHDLARRLLARCLVKLGRYQDAKEHLERLREKFPDDAELDTLLARSEHDLGHQDAARARLDAVVSAHPEHVPALRERGRLALAAGQLADAESDLKRALHMAPHDYDARWALQQVLENQGRSAEAAAQRDEAQRLKDRLERISEIQMHEMATKPFDARLHAELGELLLAVGQPDSAERWLQSALHLDPNLTRARDALAVSFPSRR